MMNNKLTNGEKTEISKGETVRIDGEESSDWKDRFRKCCAGA